MVVEAPRRTAVVADYDVLVVGGGPAGVMAALAAARSGSRVLCVERHGMLGGVWTAGLLNPVFDAKEKGWLVQELIDELRKAGAWQTWIWNDTDVFDTEVMKLVLEQMFEKAGVDFWYHSMVVDAIVEQSRVRGAIIESKSGREAVLANVVIDCSGDGDFAALAGAAFALGRHHDGLCQPLTMMFEVDGVKNYRQSDTFTLHAQLLESIKRQGSPIQLPFDRVNYAPWVIHVPREDAASVQATHVYRVSALDVRAMSKATAKARQQAHDLVTLMRSIPGMENIRLTQTAPAIGVRECRRIQGHYTLSLDDLKTGNRFADAITFGRFGVDIHEVNPGNNEKSAHHTRTLPYEIPLRCLLPAKIEGLLMAGRCISGTHEAHASYRVTGICMGMGQAAGLAASMAVHEKTLPQALDGAAVKAELVARGVGFLGKAS